MVEFVLDKFRIIKKNIKIVYYNNEIEKFFVYCLWLFDISDFIFELFKILILILMFKLIKDLILFLIRVVWVLKYINVY